VINTHHHFDHTGGNLELKRQYEGLQVGRLSVESSPPIKQSSSSSSGCAAPVSRAVQEAV
jgi:beta-lactamase superfamily II metal-dependent hydrolase